MAWRSQDEVNNVNQFTRINADLVIDYNPKDFNGVADALAWHGRSNLELTLFHNGLDLPRWLMDVVDEADLSI